MIKGLVDHRPLALAPRAAASAPSAGTRVQAAASAALAAGSAARTMLAPVGAGTMFPAVGPRRMIVAPRA